MSGSWHSAFMSPYWMFGMGLTICGWVAYICHLLPYYKIAGLFAIANAASAIYGYFLHDRVGVFIDLAVGGFFAWQWWKGGGGNDTKKRLRAMLPKFEPTRRTAPVRE